MCGEAAEGSGGGEVVGGRGGQLPVEAVEKRVGG